MDEHEYEQRALEINDRIATMADDEIRAAYLSSDGEPGDPWIEALSAAMREREIDD